MVAEENHEIAGFADLEANGHIDLFYVSADFQRRGVGKRLMNAILAESARLGLQRLFSEVSLTARPFFQAQGFQIDAEQTVTVNGVDFINFRMSRQLTP